MVDQVLTIGQLAAYAGVTVAAVRHYHKLGLLAEPERSGSGYRSYDAAAVVRLIRIRVLANAGVPLARIDRLLDADPAEFSVAVEEIDKGVGEEIARMRATRKRLGQLTAGKKLALPESVVSYLDRLRSIGASEQYIELERDAWIIVAAQFTDRIDEFIEQKNEMLDSYREFQRVYSVFGDALHYDPDDPRLIEVADLLDQLFLIGERTGQNDDNPVTNHPALVELLDTMMIDAIPAASRLLELLEERGWRGWTNIDRVERYPQLER